MSKAEAKTETSGAAADGVLHVAFVLDKSGSMRSIEEAVVAGYNDYLRELRAQGGETLFSLTTFDTTLRARLCRRAARRASPELDHALYRPDGMTALYDAIAHTVLETDQRLQARGPRRREGARRRDDGRARELLDRLRRARDRGTRARLRRAAELDVRLPRRRPRRGSRTPSTRPPGWATGTRTRCSGRPTRPPRASRCARSPTRPARRRASTQLKSERFFADAGQSTADYREDEPARPGERSVARRRRADAGVRRRSIAVTSATPSPGRIRARSRAAKERETIAASVKAGRRTAVSVSGRISWCVKRAGLSRRQPASAARWRR